MARQEAGKQSPSRWRRDGVDLQALEDKLRIEIDPAFFEPEQDFRFQRLISSSNAVHSPFNQVIEVLSVSLDQDGEDDRNPDFEQLADNPLHKNIQQQLQVCSNVVERITVEHHGSLNSSVQAMGGVARHYNQTRTNVGTLREQLRECKQLLQTGVSQTDVRELWQRKLQYSLVLRLLGALDMIKAVSLIRIRRQHTASIASSGRGLVMLHISELTEWGNFAEKDGEEASDLGEKLLHFPCSLLLVHRCFLLYTPWNRRQICRVHYMPNPQSYFQERLIRDGKMPFRCVDVSKLDTLKCRYAPSPSPLITSLDYFPLLRDMLFTQDAPVKFERLVRQKRFVAAVTLLNESLLNIFSPELVDVPAVSSVRDEMLVQKGRILDMLVEEIVDVLFLRATTTQFKSTDQSRGAAKSRRRRERGGANSTVTEDHLPAVSRTHGTVGFGTSGGSTDAASESSAGEGDTIAMSWAGIAVDVTDVGDEDEQALENPSQEFSVYLRLLVEAVRRLRCLDDVERYLLERLRNEVVTLSAINMRTCVGRHEDDAAKSRGGSANGSSRSDMPSTRLQRLIPYLSLVFESFTFVLANHMHLVRLLHAARLRDLRESDPGTPVFEADAPYKESLVLSLWQHIQTHLMEVLSRHIESQVDVDSMIETGKFNAGKSEMAMRRTTYRSGPHNIDQSLMPSKGTQVPLRRPEPSTVGIVGAALELDHASAADYSRTCMLADPSPLVLIVIFRPTLRFVEIEQGMINAMRKEVLESGHIRERPGRRVVQEAADNEGSSLSTFMHNAARDKLLPLLSADCQKTYRELVGDQDSFLPRSMASVPQASAKRNSAESSRGGSAPGNPVRERKSIGAGSIQPSKGAEDIYVQARTLFRAMVQMSHYSEEIGEILRGSLEDYFSTVQRMFQDITESSASRSRLERFSDKLRDLLHRDAHHLTYKTHVYGRHLRWDEDGEVNDVLSMKGSVHRNTGGSNHGIDSQDSHRGIGGLAGSTAEEEADDIFESEFTTLKDLWNFDSFPFPVSKQSLLSLRKQQGVACLAFSCDWLAHKLLKMSLAIRHHGGNALAPDGQSGTSIGRSVSPSRMGESDARSAPGTDSTLAPTQKLRHMARKLSQLADDSLLCLRLEVYMMVSYYMQQLPSIDLEVASGQGSTTAMSLGSVEDQCVVDLNRCIREEQEALSPFEPKGSVGLICPRQLLAFVLAPLTRLLPRLFVRSLRFLKSKAVTVGGVGKLNKILNTLQQTVGDVTEVNKSPGQEDGLTPDAPKDSSQALVGTLAERFGWARQYVALISMSQGELEAFIRNNRTKFSKEEYRVQWSLIGPNRRPSHGGSSGKFDTWWASEKF